MAETRRPARVEPTGVGARPTAVLAAIALMLLAFLDGIGWFGGPLYQDVPATGVARPRVAALILSGDMGFHFGMAGEIADRFASHGIPVVGVNTLTFLRRARTPAETAAMIAGGMRRVRALAPGARIVLIGQSAGADTLQVGLASLPAATRGDVALVALIVPDREVRLQASPSDLFPVGSPNFSGVPSARQLVWAPLLCIQGRSEPDSLCPLVTQANATRLALPGGHPLGHDPDRVVAALFAAIRRAASLGPIAR